MPTGFIAEGRPICAAGEKMLAHGYDNSRGRRKWRCSRTCNHLDAACDCSPSTYGRVVYTYPDGNRREPPVPRDSDAWKKAYKRRTSVERSRKRTLVDRHLEAARVRWRHHWYWRTILCAMTQHADPWIEARRKQGK